VIVASGESDPEVRAGREPVIVPQVEPMEGDLSASAVRLDVARAAKEVVGAECEDAESVVLTERVAHLRLVIPIS
jgi:hypothetical protein